eukprot:g532.t1
MKSVRTGNVVNGRKTNASAPTHKSEEDKILGVCGETPSAHATIARGNIVVFYELLTGAYAGKIARKWPVGAIKDMSWSPCGSRIAIATSYDQCVSVYRIQYGMWDNVRSVLKASNEDAEFWTRHPLFLHPFRPLLASENEVFDKSQMDKGTGGGMTSRSSLTAMSESIDSILDGTPMMRGDAKAHDAGSGPSLGEACVETVRADRMSLLTARQRLSKLVVGNAVDAARQNIVKKILLPADDRMV